MRRSLVLLVALALAASGVACSPRTASLPKGGPRLTAVFDDAQHLVVGHAVQISGVTVGAVTKVALDGYRARVTLSLGAGRRIPRGTTAVLAATSLLGEQFVDLRLPDRFDPATGPFLRSGDRVPTAEEADFEQFLGKAADVLGAVAAHDLTAIVDAGATGLGGRGERLNTLIAQLAGTVHVLAEQRSDIGAAIDGLGQLGSSLAAGSDNVGVLLDDLAGTSRSLAENRQKIVGAVDSLTRLARDVNDIVVKPHLERLRTVIAQLDPIVASAVQSRSTLENLITNLLQFVTRIDKAIHNGSILIYAWFAGEATPVNSQASSTPSERLARLLDPRGSP